MEKVNLAEKLSLFDDRWHPRIVGELNGQHVKLVKVKGEFIWHRHEAEDELFLVVKGRLRIELRDGAVELTEGEFLIVPAGAPPRRRGGVPPAPLRARDDAQHRKRPERADGRGSRADLRPSALRTP